MPAASDADTVVTAEPKSSKARTHKAKDAKIRELKAQLAERDGKTLHQGPPSTGAASGPPRERDGKRGGGCDRGSRREWKES
eukprot:45822-Rhodomonas_salina.1